jgi:hypothetical protein
VPRAHQVLRGKQRLGVVELQCSAKQQDMLDPRRGRLPLPGANGLSVNAYPSRQRGL